MKVFCAPNQSGGHDTVYALLKYAFFCMYNEDLPEISKTVNGKPFFIKDIGVHFSLSHCKTHVLCGLSTSLIGVDIESPREISERAESFFYLPEERELYDPLDLWVLKESYIKLTGGILPMAKTIKFSRKHEKIIAPDKNVISKLYNICGCTAAVSSLHIEPPDIIEYVEHATVDTLQRL